MTYGDVRDTLAAIKARLVDVPGIDLVLDRDHFHAPNEAAVVDQFHPVCAYWSIEGRMAYNRSYLTTDLLGDIEAAAILLRSDIATSSRALTREAT